MGVALSEPDTIMPEQYASVFVSRQQMPEKRLFAAVLMEAVADFRDCLRCPGKRESWTFQELLAWFFNSDKKWPFSFENLCEQLDLDPGCVRRQIVLQLKGASKS